MQAPEFRFLSLRGPKLVDQAVVETEEIRSNKKASMHRIVESDWAEAEDL